MSLCLKDKYRGSGTSGSRGCPTLKSSKMKTSQYAKEHANQLQHIKANLDNLEEYSRKNIQDEVNLPTDQVICETAQTTCIKVEMQKDDIDTREATNRSWQNTPCWGANRTWSQGNAPYNPLKIQGDSWRFVLFFFYHFSVIFLWISFKSCL